ncbi:hypothetical protein GCM10010329_86510 [Streptomyces spiroverticillatus]|uniref:Uncharacterized protein n=1 Tax=Streptomyces finlayi TaxID=67296 RepID=A0A919CH05_9ACTN|nr:hypothetical protein GCM10010329_86510 [Streptomyces spiroverticillatus]GHD20139.1 hypothetical protein GCM10010334_84370 [Streptomyces finlayi]
MRGVQAHSPASKRRRDHVDRAGVPGLGARVVAGGADVVGDARDRQLGLAAAAGTVSTEIETEAGDPRLRKAGGQAGKEATFLAGNPGPMDQDRGPDHWAGGRGKRAGQSGAVQ